MLFLLFCMFSEICFGSCLHVYNHISIFTLSIGTPEYLALWVKFSADVKLKYFFLFSHKTGFDISCKLSPMETIGMKCLSCKLSPMETIGMKCQILFSRKIKKNISVSSAELAREC